MTANEQLNMSAFPTKKYRRVSTENATFFERIGIRYRASMNRHPFLLFGLPFISIIVASSFLLTPATALRYERHDRKVRTLNEEEALGLGLRGPGEDSGVKRNPRRRIVGSEKDEYYVRNPLSLSHLYMASIIAILTSSYEQRLMAKDLDSWEQKRVKRFEGEPDGRL